MGLSTHLSGPPLVDAHVHIKKVEGLSVAAAAGIVAMRDAGLNHRSWSPSRANQQIPDFPAVLFADRALYKKGGYGSLLGVAIDTQDEIKSEILKLKDAGAGIIKVIASGVVDFSGPDRITAGGFSAEELACIVEEAGGVGLMVMAHANGERAIMAAAEAGVRSIEHGFFMTEHALESMAKRGTFWTPTVGALERAAAARKMTKEMKAFVAGLIEKHLLMMGKAHRAGVPLAIGTDCVLPHPEYKNSYNAELLSFERAGLSREDALKIACEGGARLLGI